MEVDLRKTLVSMFTINGKDYNIEYEGLNHICFNCGRFGHWREMCSVGKESPKVPGAAQSEKTASAPSRTVGEQDPFGPWMIARRPQRRGNTKSAPQP